MGAEAGHIKKVMLNMSDAVYIRTHLQACKYRKVTGCSAHIESVLPKRKWLSWCVSSLQLVHWWRNLCQVPV